MRPEVAPIVGDAERRARIACSEEFHRTIRRPAVEADKVIPDRRLTQGLVLEPRHEDGRGEGVPLDHPST